MGEERHHAGVGLGVILAIGLAACGGGGGASTPTSTPNAPQSVTLDRHSVSGSFERFESGLVFVTASLPSQVGSVFVQLQDDNGVLSARASDRSDVDKLRLAVTTNPALATGAYVGVAQLKLCLDQECTNPLPGSPIAVPYSITVKGAPAPGALSVWPGVTGWVGENQAADHVRAVDAALDPSKFRLRYVWSENAGSAIQPMAVAGGRAVLSTDSAVVAIDEATGATLWKSLQPGMQISAPGLTPDSVVFTARSLDTHANRIVGLRVSTGEQSFDQAYAAAGWSSHGPTVTNGKMLVRGEAESSALVFDANTGLSLGSLGSGTAGFHGAASDDVLAYNYSGSCFACDGAKLTVYGLNTGSTIFEIPDTRNGSADTLPVGDTILAGLTQVLVLGDPLPGSVRALKSFDLHTHTVGWSVDDEFGFAPAVANDTVYLTTRFDVQARSLVSGQLLWSWRSEDQLDILLSCPPVATRTHLFICTSSRLRAIDLRTHKEVWGFGAAVSQLALSENGVLHALERSTSPQARVFAFDLK